MENYPLTYLIIRKLFPRFDYYWARQPEFSPTQFRVAHSKDSKSTELVLYLATLKIIFEIEQRSHQKDQLHTEDK